LRETFDEYKETLERNFINFNYLYDGDIIYSKDFSYTESVPNHSISPSFIIRTIDKIYRQSFQNLIIKSTDIIINYDFCKNNLSSDKIFSIIDNLNIKPVYVFCSDNSKKHFGIIKERNVPFPKYFYNIQTIYNKNYDFYTSPMVEDSDDELILYVVDSSIQSLVYSIQNMEYKIVDDGLKKNHTIKCPFYECDFNSYKVIIKDISKIREEKIDKVLS
jgi:hypothetical protein